MSRGEGTLVTVSTLYSTGVAEELDLELDDVGFFAPACLGAGGSCGGAPGEAGTTGAATPPYGAWLPPSARTARAVPKGGCDSSLGPGLDSESECETSVRGDVSRDGVRYGPELRGRFLVSEVSTSTMSWSVSGGCCETSSSLPEPVA